MSSNEQKEQIFREILEGNRRPFLNVYEAVAEQFLLLSFKARQLYKKPRYMDWFIEQDRVLHALCDKHQAIGEIYHRNNIGLSGNNNPEGGYHPLHNALFIMQAFYNGFDNGKVGMQTWGEMNRLPNSRTRFRDNKIQDFVHFDLFNILTKDNTSCEPISSFDRMGYSHQDLSIAVSHTELIIKKINNFFKIDHLDILAETIDRQIEYYRHKTPNLPDWLESIKTDRHDINKILSHLFKADAKNEIEFFLALYDLVFAQHTCNWIIDVTRYFKINRFVDYAWRFKTIEYSEHNKKPLFSQDEHACQITIGRLDLLELIRKNGLNDAMLHLSKKISEVYGDNANTEYVDDSFQISKDEKNEHEVSSRELYSHDGVLLGTYLKYLCQFSEWYDTNKVLFSYNLKRKDKININTWFLGLKCYDLKNGIPNKKKLKLKEDIYDQLRIDTELCGGQSYSNISFQRYHIRVKDIINENIDELIKNQQDKNKNYSFNGYNYIIKPFWE